MRLRAFVEALRPCGLAARSDSEPLAATQSLRGSLEAVRAGSPQRLRAFVEALRPCGLAARSDSEPLW